jgi:aldehyde dehydrogenase (NAD+)
MARAERRGTGVSPERAIRAALSIIAYGSEDEAISIANDSKYGLHAAVVGTDLPSARRVASQLRAGRVVINGMTDDPQAPSGGFNTPASAGNMAGTGSRRFLNRGPSKAPLESGI